MHPCLDLHHHAREVYVDYAVTDSDTHPDGYFYCGGKSCFGEHRTQIGTKGQATAYLAARNIVLSIAAGIGPVLGGKLADFFAVRELSWILRWTSPERELLFHTLNLQQWDFFFFSAFLIGIYSIHRLGMVKEVGEVKERIVLRELMAEVGRSARNLSTIGGLRHLTQFPFFVVRSTHKKGK